MTDMTVVVDASYSPRSIGIGINRSTLWAMSGCCNGRIHYDHREQFWYCAECTKFAAWRKDAPGHSCEELGGHTEVTDSFVRWVARWIGIEPELVNIKLEWDEAV